jgi:uncharacterized membrane protein YfcA
MVIAWIAIFVGGWIGTAASRSTLALILALVTTIAVAIPVTIRASRRRAEEARRAAQWVRAHALQMDQSESGRIVAGLQYLYGPHLPQDLRERFPSPPPGLLPTEADPISGEPRRSTLLERDIPGRLIAAGYCSVMAAALLGGVVLGLGEGRQRTTWTIFGAMLAGLAAVLIWQWRSRREATSRVP